MNIKQYLSDGRLRNFQDVKTVEEAFNNLRFGGAVKFGNLRMFVDHGDLSFDNVMYGTVKMPETAEGLQREIDAYKAERVVKGVSDDMKVF